MALQHATTTAIRDQQATILRDWVGQLASGGFSSDRRAAADEVDAQARDFLGLFCDAAGTDDFGPSVPAWAAVRGFLENLSRRRATQGFSAEQTANFIFSLKRPLFGVVERAWQDEPKAYAGELWAVSELLDSLGMHTVNTFQHSREQVIARQQEELLELSTPVVKLWEGVLALPMIGTLDSARTQVVMESLLQRIAETGAGIAIIDITGVPTVDTLVAQHLLKTATAIRLMGADCIISGIRPQIAQTIVHLGVDLQGITTKGNMADALALALRRSGQSIVRA
ncbi:STAS domain-containing protein [Coralloluteibacterium stylophorae]|uniref:STAS domain-containing protein n=2 Tax=Coralloluteibacterium stylophorae TaxID=1776034 RepID=A0AAP2CBY9_9GAMM|nr:STAS domain-containing protein [Coralloluteibacterium stylophorae]MBS7457431.1 STAS domain-containing protein [Coralloluteibacterium stylophorae]